MLFAISAEGALIAKQMPFASLFAACTPCTSTCHNGTEQIAHSNPQQEEGFPVLCSETQVPRPTKLRSDSKRLHVPPIFSRFQFSVIYTQLGATQGTLMEQQRLMLQSILKHFVRELSNGVYFSIVDRSGRSVEHFCRLDRNMTQLTMFLDEEAKGTAKAVVFRDIERICSPEEVRNLRVTNSLFIDECCTTVVLTNSRFVTFRMESVAAREYLMLCMQVLRMSQERPRMWYG